MTVHATRIEATGEIQSLRPAGSVLRGGVYARFLKRTLDVTLIVMSLPFVVPFLLIIAFLIFLNDRHSPIFVQERIGMNGRRFKIWKFRTMVPKAEALLDKHLCENPAAKAEWEEKQKLSTDPRVTSIGRVLRSSSMDELPQILNVLTGDMSIVGPRPMMPSQQALYPGHGYYRLNPGITGSWQVSVRNESSFADRAGFDDEYERTLSFAGDAGIVAKTFGAILRGTGV